MLVFFGVSGSFIIKLDDFKRDLDNIFDFGLGLPEFKQLLFRLLE